MQSRAFMATIGLDYDALTKEEFVSIISGLKKIQVSEKPHQPARENDHEPWQRKTGKTLKQRRCCGGTGAFIYRCFPRRRKLHIPRFVAPPFPTKSPILRRAPSDRRSLFLKNPAFVPQLTSQNPSVLLPRKSACRHTLPCCRVRRPLLSASTGSKGITHSTFLRKIVCQQGCSRPYWKPGVKGALPLKFLIFLADAYTKCKNAACNACSENEKNSAAARYAYGSTAFFY